MAQTRAVQTAHSAKECMLGDACGKLPTFLVGHIEKASLDQDRNANCEHFIPQAIEVVDSFLESRIAKVSLCVDLTCSVSPCVGQTGEYTTVKSCVRDRWLLEATQIQLDKHVFRRSQRHIYHRKKRLQGFYKLS